MFEVLGNALKRLLRCSASKGAPIQLEEDAILTAVSVEDLYTKLRKAALGDGGQYGAAVLWAEMPEAPRARSAHSWATERAGVSAVVAVNTDTANPSDHFAGAEDGNVFYPLPTLVLTSERFLEESRGDEWTDSYPSGWRRYTTFAGEEESGAFDKDLRRLARMPWIQVRPIPCSSSDLKQAWHGVLAWAALRKDLSVLVLEDQEDQLKRRICATAKDNGKKLPPLFRTVNRQSIDDIGRAGTLPLPLYRACHVIGIKNRPDSSLTQAESTAASMTKAVDSVEEEGAGQSGVSGVFMDMNLEGVDYTGLDVLCRLKPVKESPDLEKAKERYKQLGHCPVIALTSYADKRHIIEAIRAGADDYIYKHKTGTGLEHDQGVQWRASILHACGALFVLYARLEWLKYFLRRVVLHVCTDFFEDTELNRVRRDVPANFFREKVNRYRRELDQEFPTGGVPSFLVELHGVAEVLLHEMGRIGPVDLNALSGQSALTIRGGVQRVREALEAVPHVQRSWNARYNDLFVDDPNFTAKRLRSASDELEDAFHVLRILLVDVERRISKHLGGRIANKIQEL